MLGSYMEGLPVVFVKSMACGVPVVAPSVAGIPELVRHGETGWLYTVGSADDLKNALLQAVADRQQWTRIGSAAREFVAGRHDITSTVSRFSDLLKSER